MSAAGVDDDWTSFFVRVKQRPDSFYTKCIERLTSQDLFEPGDLADLEEEQFATSLMQAGATAGEVGFLKQAVSLAKADANPPTVIQERSQDSSIPVAPVQSTSSSATLIEPVPQRQEQQEEEDEEVLKTPNPVLSVILPGNEDPAKMLKRGGLELTWNVNGRPQKVNKFQEVPVGRVADMNIGLPTLYIHLLDGTFCPRDGDFDRALRAGNDNAELQIVLPEAYSTRSFDDVQDEDLRKNLSIVLSFLRSQGEMQISQVTTRPGGFGASNFSVAANPERLYFALQTSRPKAGINLDKASFGIPEAGDIYLFAQNHSSVAHMSVRERDAFQACIGDLSVHYKDDLRKLSVFLKIFYEGGFAYNKKKELSNGGGAYVPINVGIGGLGTTPMFSGQAGIATGFPYLVESQFLRFCDTVPVTIPAISDMSARHGRYGLCFTRCIFVWAGDRLATEGILNFCSILPHGGFYYVPSTLKAFHKRGGLIYSFGEAKEEQSEEVASETATAVVNGSSFVPAAREMGSNVHRVCVICMSNEAVMAIRPCGHLSFCESCAPEALKRKMPCPVCRRKVDNVWRVYC